MKKISLLFLSLFTLIVAHAWTPQGFTYQAVIRDSDNNILANTEVGVQISIIYDEVGPFVEYAEIFLDTTNENGLISLEIGSGLPQLGNFDQVFWTNGTGGDWSLLAEIDPNGGSNYSILVESPLLSVPFAIHSGSSDTTLNEVDPLFESSIAANITANDTSNWNSKIDTESDPIYGTSVAAGITGTDVTNWNNKLDSEVDGSTTNEIQNLSINHDTISISGGNSVAMHNFKVVSFSTSGVIDTDDQLIRVTAGGVEVTFPASPRLGQMVYLTGRAALGSSINFNGNNLRDTDDYQSNPGVVLFEDMTDNTNYFTIQFMFTGFGIWQVFNEY